MGECGGRLAQAHVVGQAAAEAEAVEELQPAQATLLIRPQRGGERVRHIAIGQCFVGQTVQQFAGPTRCLQQVGAIALTVCSDAGGLELALQFGSQRQQLQGTHLAVVGSVLLEVGQRPACLGAVDLHPSTTDLNQIGAILGGTAQNIVGHGRVVDHDLPIDQCSGCKSAAAGCVLGLSRGAGGRAPAGELLGREQFDADSGQCVDAFQRGGRRVEVDAMRRGDQGGVEPGGQLGDGRCNCRAGFA